MDNNNRLNIFDNDGNIKIANKNPHNGRPQDNDAGTPGEDDGNNTVGGGDSLILWSDNPETEYLAAILERERQTRIAQGYDGQDDFNFTIGGGSTIDGDGGGTVGGGMTIGASTLGDLSGGPLYNNMNNILNSSRDNYTLASTIEDGGTITGLVGDKASEYNENDYNDYSTIADNDNLIIHDNHNYIDGTSSGDNDMENDRKVPSMDYYDDENRAPLMPPSISNRPKTPTSLFDEYYNKSQRRDQDRVNQPNQPNQQTKLNTNKMNPLAKMGSLFDDYYKNEPKYQSQNQQHKDQKSVKSNKSKTNTSDREAITNTTAMGAFRNITNRFTRQNITKPNPPASAPLPTQEPKNQEKTPKDIGNTNTDNVNNDINNNNSATVPATAPATDNNGIIPPIIYIAGPSPAHVAVKPLQNSFDAADTSATGRFSNSSTRSRRNWRACQIILPLLLLFMVLTGALITALLLHDKRTASLSSNDSNLLNGDTSVQGPSQGQGNISSPATQPPILTSITSPPVTSASVTSSPVVSQNGEDNAVKNEEVALSPTATTAVPLEFPFPTLSPEDLAAGVHILPLTNAPSMSHAAYDDITPMPTSVTKNEEKTTNQPTSLPVQETSRPTLRPTSRTTQMPTNRPVDPTNSPTAPIPRTDKPTYRPTRNPRTDPPVTIETAVEHTRDTAEPTVEDTVEPSPEPTPEPTRRPTKRPTSSPVQEGFTLDTLRDLILSMSSSFDETHNALLNDEFSDQYMALEWLLIDPNLSAYTDYKILQRFVLSTMFLSTNGFYWSNIDDFLSEKDECFWLESWGNRACDGNGHLVILDLEGNNLQGSIPREIGLLSQSLERIYLPRNDIVGTLPKEIGLLSRLERLDLGRCDLTGTIPTEIGKLKRLRVLAFGRNDFDGTLPEEIGELTQLEYLSLERNSLTGTIPSEIGLLEDVEYIGIDWNEFHGTVPREISTLYNLHDFFFARNNLFGDTDDVICKLPNLDSTAADCSELMTCTCCSICCVDGSGCHNQFSTSIGQTEIRGADGGNR